MQNPVVTVVIATCGRPERLRTALEHVLRAATRIGGCPVIVVDNHPAYTAEAVVREMCAERLVSGGLCRAVEMDEPFSAPRTTHQAPSTTHSAPRTKHQAPRTSHSAPSTTHFAPSTKLTYLRSEPFNKARALNMGIAAAETAWLAFTDDDTLPDEKWLEEGMRFARQAGVRAFAGRVVAGPTPDGLPRWLLAGRSGRVPSVGVFVRYEPLKEDGLLPGDAPAPFGANVFIRSDVFREHGCYDEILWDRCRRTWPLGSEDSEFGHRLKLRGEAIGYCHGALVVHPVNADRASIKLHLWQAYCDGWRQPLIFAEENRPWFERFRLRLLGRFTAGCISDFFRRDPGGAVQQLVEVARLAGSIVGRWKAGGRKPVSSVVSRTGNPHVPQAGCLKIGFFTSIEEYGGSEMYLRSIIIGVRSAGHDVILFGVGSARLTRDLNDLGVRCVAWRREGQSPTERWQEEEEPASRTTSGLQEAKSMLAKGIPRSLRIVLGARRDARRLREMFKEYDLDLMHVNVHGYEAACRACRLAGIPSIAMCLNYPVGTWDAGRRYLRRSLLRTASRVASQSAACSRAWAEVADLECWKVSHIWNSANEGLLDLQRTPWTAGRTLRILATGRMHWMKGYDGLIDAMGLLRDMDVRLCIAGEGRERETLTKRAETLGLGGRVDLPGHVANVPRLLEENDLYVIPSVALESGPAALAEAMMAGLPCVTSDFAPLAEMNVDGVTGLVVPARDSAALASAIRHLAGDPVAMEAMSRAARHRARTWFTRGDMIQRHLRMYEEVAGKGSATGVQVAPTPE